ncbi:hypothetical protein PRNP1_012110 [Phytophthora ramorum]
MKAGMIVVSLIGLTSTSTAVATPSWHDLAITAPQYGRYLYRTASEEPFFWQADTAWELVHKLNKTFIDFYLRTRAEQGYNAVQTIAISENNGTTRANIYGDLPFANSDTTQPNGAYFQLIDWTVERAASYGILMVLVPAWGNWISGGWHETEESLFNDTNGANTPDVDPATLVGTIEDTTHLWVSMRSGVKHGEKAQGYEPVILFHPTAGRIARPASTPMAYGHLMLPNEEDRVSIDAVQSGHATPESLGPFTPFEARDSTKNYELIAAMRDGFTGPVLDLENHYEGAHYNFDPSIRSGTRRNVWQMYEPRSDLLRDSDYYSPSVNQNASGSWRIDIFFKGATQIQYVTKPLQNLTIDELEQLEPARHLLSSPSGYTDIAVNAFESTRFISVLASETRNRFYVYTGHGDSFGLNVGNGSERSGTARWFSPRDGEYYSTSTVEVPANVTRVDFTPPSGGSVDDDWLLVLEF